MAEIQIYQAKDAAANITVRETIEDLDLAIRGMWDKVISDPHPFPTPFIRYGMPGKFPEGKRGFVIAGLTRGAFEYPVPDPDEYRVAYRAPEIPMYKVIFGKLERRRLHGTEYWREHHVKMANPRLYWNLQARSAAKSYPMYLEYLSYSIYNNGKEEIPMFKEYIGKFYEESDGANSGFSFYRGGAYEVNLKKAIAREAVKQHEFKEKLKGFREKLYDNAVKTEIDIAKLKSKLPDKDLFKKNVVSEIVKKFVCMCDFVREFLDETIRVGRLDKKYKLDNTQLEGYVDNFNPSNYVLLIPMRAYNEWQRSRMYDTPGKEGFAPTSEFFRGVEVIPCQFMDDSDMIMHHRDLIQMGFLNDPMISRSYTKTYDTEGTTDYITDFAHTCDMIPIYDRVWFRLKGA